MKTEVKRKFGVEEINSFNLDTICSECGERLGEHVNTTCPPKIKKRKACLVEQRVKHPCQQLRDNGNACRSGKKTKLHKVFGDAEMYRGLWLKVYLCPRCAKEAGV